MDSPILDHIVNIATKARDQFYAKAETTNPLSPVGTRLVFEAFCEKIKACTIQIHASSAPPEEKARVTDLVASIYVSADQRYSEIIQRELASLREPEDCGELPPPPPESI
jgi:hypothetical protein